MSGVRWGGYGNVTFWSRGTLGGVRFGFWRMGKKRWGGDGNRGTARFWARGTEIGVRPRFWGILSQGYGNVAKIGVRK